MAARFLAAPAFEFEALAETLASSWLVCCLHGNKYDDGESVKCVLEQVVDDGVIVGQKKLFRRGQVK